MGHIPRSTRWEGQDLINLLSLDIPTLQKMYGYKPDYLATCRYRKRKELKKGKIAMPEGEPVVEGKLAKTWEVAAFDREANDWTTHTLHSWEHTPEVPEDWVPATPARITPSKRKPAVRDHRTLFVFSDAQIDYRRLEDGSLEPIHDERAVRVAHLLCRDVQPDQIINLGDTVDLASLSRFKADSNHFQRTLGPAFQRVHNMYAQFRADTPQARIIEVDSNHNTRLKDYLLKNAPDMYGFRRPGAPENEPPMFTYGYMANLAHAGVEFISGYGAAEYLYGEEYETPPIRFIHGQTNASNASVAAKESKLNPETHLVRGHGHRLEQHTRTTRAGHYLTSLQIGALCRITGEVPSYHSGVDDRGQVVKYQEDWSQGVLLIRDYDGEYEFVNIPIREGIALFNGRIYNGGEG